ncbi:MAG: DNA polymerase III subunit alpha [Candidatus Promineifilaceae bacterium]|nr:DNA polymerase III subunit alpha [Candidatus Promineifilaceae bacterium]
MQETHAPIPGTFTHLEVHSHYTLLEATPSIEALVQQAQTDGLSSLALTDSNALYGAVQFDAACRRGGIRPILGMTVSVSASPTDALRTTSTTGQVILLATGPAGYRSLCRLTTLLQGGPDRQERLAQGLSWAELKAHRDGLICISGGYTGWIRRYLLSGNQRAARRYVARLGGIYGENAYLGLELQRLEDAELAQEIVDLSQRFGLPVTALQPVYALEAGEAERLRLLAAIKDNCRLETVPADLPGLVAGKVRHWLDPQAMAERFTAFPEAMVQAGAIAARCQPTLPQPEPPIWTGFWRRLAKQGKVWAAKSAPEALAEQAQAGLIQQYGPTPAPAVQQRLERELQAIGDVGYGPLFLIVADAVAHARQREIPVSTRGSVANSLVAYCLKITTVDPVANDLLFERFLNPARRNPPDIDLDFCSRRRDEILDYLRSVYGAEHMALVATLSTMQPKSAVREGAKALGLEDVVTAELLQRLPRTWHPDPRRRSRQTMPELADDIASDQQRAVIEAAELLVGMPHHLSLHPGGVIITPERLTDTVPLQWAPKGFATTQYDHRDLERLGLAKLDLLGIRALTVLADAAELVRQHHDPAFRLNGIPLDDSTTARLLATGRTVGVFQCESTGAQRTLRQLRASSITDLAVANAFFKPGPATGGMARTFVRRYRNEAPVAYLHPALAPILETTKGVLIFQEQILRLATEIAGLTWEEADHLRRGMSKFQAEEMEAIRVRFIHGCQRPPPSGPGLTLEQAETLWGQVAPFAGYGFNRGHATAYADVSFRSAYLKAHWPAAFLAARLADRGGFYHPAVYIAEARRLGIAVYPPHVNHSQHAFSLERVNGRAILWMGLGQVRQLRRDSIAAIVAGRPFASLGELVERVTLQDKELRHLIQAGALEGLGQPRAMLLAQASLVARAGSARQQAFDFASPQPPADSPGQRLAWEKRILGQPISVHPLTLVDAGRLEGITTLTTLPKPHGQRVTVAGARLPGWTGGSSFYLDDGQSYILVKSQEAHKPPSWQPLRIRGRWLADEWGGAWLQAESIHPLNTS